jgi:uncharacterized phage protein (TIGR01671 family)
MREHLYRGKRIESDKWIFGSLDVGHHGKMPFARICLFPDNFCYVDPETVGQYTGLTDKNGVKIFEGDILKYKAHYFAGEYHTHVGIVEWRENAACFHCQQILSEGKRDKKDYGGLCTLHFKYDAEIVGNIHDKPDLLEVNI